MESPRILSLSDLLDLSLPLTGAASLSPEPPPSLSPPPKKPRPSLPCHTRSSPHAFSPVTHPVLLIGTVRLPLKDHSRCASKNHCLSFSDTSSTVCCSVLDFDLKILGRKIHVLAWNFVPFKDVCGGLLESDQVASFSVGSRCIGSSEKMSIYFKSLHLCKVPPEGRASFEIYARSYLPEHSFQPKFLEVSDISSSCNTYAEAIVLPYYLILPDVYVDNQQSVDLPKRIKSESRCLQCCKTLEKIPCSFTFTSANYQVSVVSGYICNYEGNTWGHMTDAQGFPRILLEFKSDCYHKYQFLRIGGFYIIKCSEEHLGCGLQGCHDFKSGKVLVTSYSTLWSLSFSLDDTPNLGEPPLDCSPGFSSVGVDKTFQEIQHPNEISFQQSGSLMLENSDVLLSFTSEETRPVNKGRSKVQDGFIRLIRSLPTCGNVLSVSACTKIMMDTSISHSVAVDPESVKVPLGNLISVSGNIENIHAYCSKSTSHMGLVNVVNTFGLNACSICIHLFEDHHMVRIHGTLSKFAYPVGMAPGVKATFHRVLMTWCLELVLTPVSFVEINSIWEVDCEEIRGRLISQSSLEVQEKESLNIASFGLTLDMVQCQESKSIRFNSRVVGIHILVLEESIPCSVKSQSMSALKLPTVNIPLAGVVVEYCGQCHGFNWSSAVEVSPSGTAVTIAADGKYMD
ncbi:hypothetical protein J5N97_005062 [Dioscorea zingiberensis]|uniref:CST complex subunit CTC1 n=1 Tax=Dioscorea zingiberensis TaxID=325984 RepID=A0A9D5D7E0_9LILI|nr:hypothetical protein J5N97_005062 [Dioscorea zingiberensis]